MRVLVIEIVPRAGYLIGSCAMAALTIGGTGPVAPPDRLSQLCRLFVRLVPERAATREGLGLGLTIAASRTTPRRSPRAA